MAFIHSRDVLIVVADPREARLFTRQGNHEPLTALYTLHASGSTAQGGESNNRPGGVSISSRMDPVRKRHMAFARQLAVHIDRLIADGVCDELVIAASCPFLGELRSALGKRAQNRLVADVDLDLMALGLSELEARLNEQLHLLRLKAMS